MYIDLAQKVLVTKNIFKGNNVNFVINNDGDWCFAHINGEVIKNKDTQIVSLEDMIKLDAGLIKILGLEFGSEAIYDNGHWVIDGSIEPEGIIIDININEAVFTTNKVLYEQDEIKLIELDENGFLSFIGYETNEIQDSNIKLVSLGSIIRRDPSVINAILNLDINQQATRENKFDNWCIQYY